MKRKKERKKESREKGRKEYSITKYEYFEPL